MSSVRYNIGAIADEVLASVRTPAVVKTAAEAPVAPSTEIGALIKQAAEQVRHISTDVTFADVEKVAAQVTSGVVKAPSVPQPPVAAASTKPASPLRPDVSGGTAGTGGAAPMAAADPTKKASVSSELGDSLRALADVIRTKNAAVSAAQTEKAAHIYTAAVGLRKLMGGPTR